MRKLKRGIIIALAVAAMACLEVPAPPPVWAQRAGSEGSSQTGGGASVDSLSKELEKNKQLLEIWKDHVKRLTKERDELKKGAPPAGAAPSTGQITTLESRIATLEAENKRLEAESRSMKSAAGPDPRLTMLERELKELRADNDVLSKDKERALAQLERLKSAPQAAPAPAPVPAKDLAAKDREIEKLKIDNEKLRRSYNYLDADLRTTREQLKGLQPLEAENARLAQESRQTAERLAQAEGQTTKTALLKDELENLRRGREEHAKESSALRSQMEKLKADQAKASQLAAENARLAKAEEQAARTVQTLKSQVEQLKADQANAAQLQKENERLVAESRAENRQVSERLAQTEDQAAKTTQALRSQIDQLKAHEAESGMLKIKLADLTKKLIELEAGIKEANADRDIANQAYADLEKDFRADQASHKQQLAKFELENENLRQYVVELKGLQKKRLQEIKAGIDAYLDKSLV